MWLDRDPMPPPTAAQWQACEDYANDRLRVCTDEEFRVWMESAS